jgi:hypothetical protein
MTDRRPRPEHQPDERPLSEKLAEHVEPVVYTIDITSGRAYKVMGSGHDIARLLEACKVTMKRVEEDKLDPEKRHAVIVPAREVHH